MSFDLFIFSDKSLFMHESFFTVNPNNVESLYNKCYEIKGEILYFSEKLGYIKHRMKEIIGRRKMCSTLK